MRELSLEEKQCVQFNILCTINKIAKKQNLKFFLAYGSLIGAVRHHGFIPWDDDIDIWVPIEQYKKFLKIIKEESNYEVISSIDDPKYPYLFSKISDKRTIIIPNNPEDKVKRGVAVDIFPLFKCEEIKKPSFMKKIIHCEKHYNIHYLDDMNISISNSEIKRYCKRLLLIFENLFGRNEIYWKKKIYKIMLKSNGKYLAGSPMLSDIHEQMLFSETKYMEFNRVYFPVPCGWKKILTNIYGNFMKLPKPEDRISNHDIKAYWK